MSKKVCIIHGWGGSPDERLHIWLRRELENRGLEVRVPKMPDTDNPKIDAWVEKLAETVKDFTEDDILVGHSIGCQTILRFLENTNQSFVRVVFLAPWLHLDGLEEAEIDIAESWVKTPINFENVRRQAKSYEIILSDDDPYVPCDETKRAFEEKLGCTALVEPGKGHFTEGDGVISLPSILSAIIKKD